MGGPVRSIWKNSVLPYFGPRELPCGTNGSVFSKLNEPARPTADCRRRSQAQAGGDPSRPTRVGRPQEDAERTDEWLSGQKSRNWRP